MRAPPSWRCNPQSRASVPVRYSSVSSFRQMPSSAVFAGIRCKAPEAPSPTSCIYEPVDLADSRLFVRIPYLSACADWSEHAFRDQFDAHRRPFVEAHALAPPAAPAMAPTAPTELAITVAPVAIPPPAAIKAPPPHAASEAFVKAAPDSVAIAVPVLAVAPRIPVAPRAAAICPANKTPKPVPARTPAPIPMAIFVVVFIFVSFFFLSLCSFPRVSNRSLDRSKPSHQLFTRHLECLHP